LATIRRPRRRSWIPLRRCGGNRAVLDWQSGSGTRNSALERYRTLRRTDP
jgi:hypothetical protein